MAPLLPHCLFVIFNDVMSHCIEYHILHINAPDKVDVVTRAWYGAETADDDTVAFSGVSDVITVVINCREARLTHGH